MTDKSQKILKKLDYTDIIYKPDGQLTKPVLDLLLFSLKGDYTNLKELLEEKEFQDSTLNLALRNLLSRYLNFNNPEYFQAYKYLLSTNIDLNYKFVKDNNSTILMKVAQTGQLIFVKELLESFNNQINSENNKFKTEENEEEYNLIQNEIFFNQKDNNNNNFLHYMIHYAKCENSEIFEYLYEEYPFEKKRKEKSSKRIQNLFKNLIKEKNDEGNNFMNICLLHGMSYLVLKILGINGYIPNLNKKNNNYIHSAILGGNMTCLKIMLYYSDYNDLNQKNVDMLTPAQLAYKMGYISMSNIILEYQENCNDEFYKEYFFKSIEYYDRTSCIDFLKNFKNYKFKQILYGLKELKIINNLCVSDTLLNNNEEDLNFKISNIKIEWNYLLTRIKQSELENDKDSENSNYNSNKTKNNKKKAKKLDEKNKNSIYPFIKSISEFYENIFSNKLINSFIDNIKEMSNNLIINNQNIDLLIFNKIIFYFRFGHLKSLFKTVEIYLTQIYQKENNMNSNFNNRTLIIYLNTTCIIIETFIQQGYEDIVEIIIKALVKYLYTKSLNLGDMQCNADDEIIFDYLNQKEVLYPIISNWNLLFIYSNFLKLISNSDKNRENLSEFKKKLQENNGKKELKIINRYKILFSCLDIKKSYEKEDNDIYQKIENFYNKEQEKEIFYLNILGIIFLKKKKYNLSKKFFEKGLKRFIQILRIKKEGNTEEKFINYRIDYITAFLYNICLCDFYLKNYEKCIKILELLLSFENNKKNYYFYFRLGLCYLEIYIQYINKNNDSFNSNIQKLIGYEYNKNSSKKTKNDKSISFNIDNESSDLSYHCESKDTNTKGNDDNKFLDFYDKQMMDLFCNYSDYNYNEYKDTNIKRIIIKNTKQNINNSSINDNKSTTKTSQNSDINIKSLYLDKAIQNFNKILIIYKICIHTNSVQSIYNFYFSYVKDNISEKDFPQKKKKIHNEFIIDTYLNILFSLSLKQNWLQMIFIIKDFNKRKLSPNKIVHLKILLFQLEAYTNLNKTTKIFETINLIKNHKKAEFNVFNKAKNDIINNINIKLYLYYSITLIYYKEKNYKEMEIYSNKVLTLIKNETNIPYYIIDLLINVYIIKLNNESNLNPKNKYKYNNIILNLIKNKKINKED